MLVAVFVFTNTKSKQITGLTVSLKRFLWRLSYYIRQYAVKLSIWMHRISTQLYSIFTTINPTPPLQRLLGMIFVVSALSLPSSKRNGLSTQQSVEDINVMLGWFENHREIDNFMRFSVKMKVITTQAHIGVV